jgi:hypothetical protein
MEISRFAARAWRGVNVQNEICFGVYDNFVSQAGVGGSPVSMLSCN